MNWDYDIIKELIPIGDKNSFIVENVYLRGDTIFAPYRMENGPFPGSENYLEEEFSWNRTAPIPLSSYTIKKRDKDINFIIKQSND